MALLTDLLVGEVKDLQSAGIAGLCRLRGGVVIHLSSHDLRDQSARYPECSFHTENHVLLNSSFGLCISASFSLCACVNKSDFMKNSQNTQHQVRDSELTTFPSSKLCLMSPLGNVTVFVFCSFLLLSLRFSRLQLSDRCGWKKNTHTLTECLNQQPLYTAFCCADMILTVRVFLLDFTYLNVIFCWFSTFWCLRMKSGSSSDRSVSAAVSTCTLWACNGVKSVLRHHLLSSFINYCLGAWEPLNTELLLYTWIIWY